MSREPKERAIQLNLTFNYANKWGIWEGIREVIQNWHDGILASIGRQHKRQFHSPVGNDTKVHYKKVNDNKKYVKYEACCSAGSKEKTKHPTHGCLYYDKENSRLILINRNTQLRRKVLLMGYTTKPKGCEQREKSTIIGQFGEGLKVGALALVRKGMGVSLETSQEKWDFRVHTYNDFDDNDSDIKGLAVYVTKRDELIYNCCPENDELDENDTCTIIGPLDEASWEKFSRNLLFLCPPEDSVSTEIGTLLLDAELAGQLYVKGVWVANFSQDNLLTGVDFITLQIDRDRNAIPRSSEIDHQMSCMWPRALLKRKSDKKLVKTFFDILKNNPNARDVRHAIKYFKEPEAKLVAEHFKREYKDKFPLLDSTDVQSIRRIQEELRREVFTCNQTLLDILLLSKKFETVEQALEQAPVRKAIPPSIKPVILSHEETSILDHAIELTRILDPSFSNQFVDVIEEEMQESVYIVNGSRIIIPRFLFRLEAVHSFSRYCLAGAGAAHPSCRCREVKLCTIFTSARQRYLRLRPRRQGYPAPDPPLTAVLGRVASLSCGKAPQFCGAGVPPPPPGDGEDTHGVCLIREEDLKKTKQELENRFKAATKEYEAKRAELKSECDMVQNELKMRDRNVDYDEKLQSVRDQYEKQLKEIQEKSDKFLKEKKEFEANQEITIEELKINIKECNNRIIRLKQEIDDMPKQLERKHHGLVDIVIEKGDLFKQMSKNLTKPDTQLKDRLKELQTASKTCEEVSELLKQEPYICVVCKHRKRSFMVQPCGHYCFCEDCRKEYEKLGEKKCPKCRVIVEDIIQVYE